MSEADKLFLIGIAQIASSAKADTCKAVGNHSEAAVYSVLSVLLMGLWLLGLVLLIVGAL